MPSLDFTRSHQVDTGVMHTDVMRTQSDQQHDTDVPLTTTSIPLTTTATLRQDAVKQVKPTNLSISLFGAKKVSDTPTTPERNTEMTTVIEAFFRSVKHQQYLPSTVSQSVDKEWGKNLPS